MEERHFETVGVGGSIPSVSTMGLWGNGKAASLQTKKCGFDSRQTLAYCGEVEIAAVELMGDRPPTISRPSGSQVR